MAELATTQSKAEQLTGVVTVTFIHGNIISWRHFRTIPSTGNCSTISLDVVGRRGVRCLLLVVGYLRWTDVLFEVAGELRDRGGRECSPLNHQFDVHKKSPIERVIPAVYPLSSTKAAPLRLSSSNPNSPHKLYKYPDRHPSPAALVPGRAGPSTSSVCMLVSAERGEL